MKKILVMITTSFVPWGGLTTVAMNYYRGMDKTGLRMDFAACNRAPQSLISELSENGGRYIRLPDRKRKMLNYMIALYRLLKEEKYDIVHIHGNSATMAVDLLPSLAAGVEKRIAHVHAQANQHKLVHAMLYPFFNRMVTRRIAVSKVSGKYLYGKNEFIVLNNAIDVEHYRFQTHLREKCRKRYGVSENAYVIGTVGKLNEDKNQTFLIDIFAEILKTKSDAKLLIVGGGGLKDKLTEQIQALRIEESCILAGMQNDTAAFLSAMDVFVFPSLREGLGLAVIEAQAAGLPCIVSDTVPSETKVSEHIEYINLNLPLERWAERIVSVNIEEREGKSEKACQDITDCGYNIEREADKLREIYLQPA